MADQHTLYEHIVRSALLGQSKSPFSLPPAADELSALIRQIPAQPPEALLLQTAVACIHLQRATRALSQDAPGLQAWKDGTSSAPTHEVPASATQVLREILYTLPSEWKGWQKDFLHEWLERCRQHQAVVPASLLPDLLEHARSWQDGHPLLRAVLGNRGALLARANFRWDYASLDTPASEEQAIALWETGDSATRLTLFRRLRHTQPDAARQSLLLATWDQESPKDRLAFLQAMHIGLSITDEPFLEEMLDAKRKELRQEAVSLLRKLPTSRWTDRMIERARTHINIQGNTLHVTLPEACNPAMLRDGIEPKLPEYLQRWGGERWGFVGESAERAFWLYQICCNIPLAEWEAVWSVEPSVALQLVRSAPHGHLLMATWVQSSQTSVCSPEWAGFLLGCNELESYVNIWDFQYLLVQCAFLQILPEADQNAFWHLRLFQKNISAIEHTARWFKEDAFPYQTGTTRIPEQTSLEVIQALQVIFSKPPPLPLPDLYVFSDFTQLALALTVTPRIKTALDGLEQCLHGEHGALLNQYLIAPLRFRIKIYNAFLPDERN